MTRAGWAIRATAAIATLTGIVIFADRCRRAALEGGGKW